MVQAIHNSSMPAWFCSKCEVAHHVLYINGEEYYCNSCVPQEIKELAIHMNQNRELITK